jgi:hypothetical protein
MASPSACDICPGLFVIKRHDNDRAFAFLETLDAACHLFMI